MTQSTGDKSEGSVEPRPSAGARRCAHDTRDRGRREAIGLGARKEKGATATGGSGCAVTTSARCARSCSDRAPC